MLNSTDTIVPLFAFMFVFIAVFVENDDEDGENSHEISIEEITSQESNSEIDEGKNEKRGDNDEDR